MYVRKVYLLVNQTEIPNLYSLDLLRRHFVSALWFPFLGYGWLWGPALIGLAATRRRPGAQFAGVLTLFYAASLLPFFVVDRYRAPLLPALALLAAGSAVWTVREWKAGGRDKVVVSGAVALGLMVIGHLPVSLPASARAAERALAGYAYLRSGDPASALTWYEEARALAPEDENVWVGWAESVSALGPEDVELLVERARSATEAMDLFMIGKRLRQLDRPRAAAAAFEASELLAPRYIRTYLHLAELYAGPGWNDRARAAESLERALAVDPVNVEVLDALDGVEWGLGFSGP